MAHDLDRAGRRPGPLDVAEWPARHRCDPMTPAEASGGACVACDRRSAEPESLLCARDLEQLVALLGELAVSYRALDPAPGSGGANGGRGAPGFGSRSPAREAVLVLTDRRFQAFDPTRPEQPAGIVCVLGWWADRAREEDLLPARRTPRTVDAEAHALVSRVEQLARRWWVGEMITALRHAVRHVRWARGQLEPTVPIGQCPSCTGQIRARSWGKQARCQGCGMDWAGEQQLRALGEQLGDAEMDAAGIARYCAVQVSTVRVWAHRFEWTRVRRGGRTLYSLADARAAVIRLGRAEPGAELDRSTC